MPVHKHEAKRWKFKRTKKCAHTQTKVERSNLDKKNSPHIKKLFLMHSKKKEKKY